MEGADHVIDYFGHVTRRVEHGNFSLHETLHSRGEPVDWHRHDRPYATLVLEGTYLENREGAPSRVDAGTIVIHDTREELEHFISTARVLNIRPADKQALPNVSAGTYSLSGHPSAAETFLRLREAWDEGGSPRRVLWMARELLSVVEARVHEAPRWLGDILANGNWLAEPHIPNIAASAGVHPARLARVFRAYVGVTPRGFRTQMRLRAASDLLLSSDVRLAQIALSCGFADQSHLTRTFSSVFGMTPSAYRRRFLRRRVQNVQDRCAPMR